MHVRSRIKSVLVVGEVRSPAGLDERLEKGGWICARAADVPTARALLHEVRPAVLLLLEGRASDDQSMKQLNADPFMAGVRMAVLPDLGRAEDVVQVLDALLVSAGGAAPPRPPAG
jgi:hypothetical protein